MIIAYIYTSVIAGIEFSSRHILAELNVKVILGDFLFFFFFNEKKFLAQHARCASSCGF